MGIIAMLLDTHIFLWWLFDDPKLPSGISEYLKNRDNDAFVSSASVWEISTKFRIGKLPEASKVAQNVSEWILRAGFESLFITHEHAQLAGSWDISHRDPFDRMLAAQAKIENIPLASVDNQLAAFPITIINS